MTTWDKTAAIAIAIVLPIIILTLVWRETNDKEADSSFPVRQDALYLVAVKSPPSRELMLVWVTGYSSTVDQTDSSPFITASGIRVRDGIVANNCLSFGATVIINNKEYEIQDRKNKRYGCEWYDIWFPTRHEAKHWGLQYLEIKI